MKNIEDRVEKLLSELTISEKVSLCHANSKFTIAAVERLGIEELTMSDGPHGIRQELERDRWVPLGRDDDFCSYLPTNTALAATWNPEMCKKFGKVLGEEARFRGKDIILGPGINIIRHPLCGRNFEYMSEDPCLTEKMTPPLIRAIQECDTAACVKHYALNNQELDRGRVNVEVSQRALFEIYLKGFKAAVKEGNAYSFMGAYNKFQNQFCCHNKYLVDDILKGEWGFDGVYLSDWAGVHNTEEAIFNGLDIEMGTNKPYNEYYLGDAFEKRVEESPEALEALNDKVRRILRLMLRVNKFSPERKKGSFNTKEHQSAIYDIATEAMVLLKNRKNILPLKNAKKLLVVGDNAVKKHAAGGNSSGVKALYEVTLLEGIKNRFTDCEIEFVRTTVNAYKAIPSDQLEIIDMNAGCRAFKCEAFENNDFSGASDITFTGKPELKEGFASYRFTAILDIKETRSYPFLFTGAGNTALFINGKLIKLLSNEEKSFRFALDLKKHDKMEILIKSTDCQGAAPGLLWDISSDVVKLNELVAKAEKADYVIYCGGINHSFDTESYDRKDMKLPEPQNTEIPAIINANKNTIIAITAGSPVEMPWIDDADTVLWTWYAGMEGGNVFADILSGKINPSGKLPFTLPYKLEDSPAVRYGEYQATNCNYNEDIFVGYRGFDKDGIDPMFCFGYGLSYSEFSYNDLAVKNSDMEVQLSFKIKNISPVPGAEIAQVYIGRTELLPTEPVRKLAAFEKVFLNGDEEKLVTITLNVDDFKDYNEASKQFELMCNNFTVFVGASSRDLPLQVKITI